MSNTNITNLQITDTFQVWVDKTNEIIDLTNENVMLAGPGPGFTIQGNSTLIGSFTANNITANTSSISNLSVVNITRAVDSNDNIISNSPVRISTGVENLLDLQTTSGNRPIIRMINGANARWVVEHDTSTANTSISIKTEGASTSQISITQTGRVIANQFQGDGSLLTNIAATAVPDISANKITSDVLDIARIPDLNANKITSGELNTARIPNLNASKITTGIFALARIPNLDIGRIPNLDASKITTGTFAVTRIPDLDASKITTGVFVEGRIPNTIVRDTRRLIPGTAITISGNGDLSSDRTINAVPLSQSQIENPSSPVFGVISGQRLQQAAESFIRPAVYVSEEIEPQQGGTYIFAHGLNRTPHQVTAELRCITASNGFEVGDIINLNTWYENQGGGGMTLLHNTTNVKVLISVFPAQLRMIHPPNNTQAILDLTNFRLRVRAW